MKTALPLWRVTIPMMMSAYVSYSNNTTNILLYYSCIVMFWCIEFDIPINHKCIICYYYV